MKKSLILVAAGLLVLGGTGCVDRQAQQQSANTAKVLSDPTHPVAVEPAATKTLQETVAVTGDVTAGQDTTVGAKSTGKVVAVYVKEGDQVTQGQVLAQLDLTALLAQMSQARAQVAQATAATAQARSALVQAERNAAIGPNKSAAAVRQAQAQVRAAQANLNKGINGARPEERRQAEAQVASAKSTLETNQKELARVKTLVQEGAIAANRLDQQQNLVDTAQAQLDNAQQALRLLQIGTRTEDIQALREQVRQAQEAVRTAKAQQELDPLLQDQVQSARAQLASAQAGLQTANAAVQIAQQAIEDATIRAPFSGKVLGKPIQVGTIAGNATAIVRIIGGAGVYFTGQLPSEQIAKVKAGMPVTISADGVAGKTFHGTVSAVSPQADSVGRLFDVRISFNDGLTDVKPGMFARGTITVRTINPIAISEDAILEDGTKSYVYVIENNKAKRLGVNTGLHQNGYVEVTGVPQGAQVVVQGKETLSEGAAVKIEPKSKLPTDVVQEGA